MCIECFESSLTVMVSYNALLQQKEFFLKLFRDTFKEAESCRPLTNASATAVQRLFRGFTVRAFIVKQRFVNIDYLLIIDTIVLIIISRLIISYPLLRLHHYRCILATLFTLALS